MGTKAERDEIRMQMLRLGCSIEQVAIEMARRFGARPRLAWRYALGWTQVQLGLRYNEINHGTSIGAERISECENWPLSRTRPSLKYLINLARTFGHSCTALKLTDLADLLAMPNDERVLLIRTTASTEPLSERPWPPFGTTLRSISSGIGFGPAGPYQDGRITGSPSLPERLTG